MLVCSFVCFFIGLVYLWFAVLLFFRCVICLFVSLRVCWFVCVFVCSCACAFVCLVSGVVVMRLACFDLCCVVRFCLFACLRI